MTRGFVTVATGKDSYYKQARNLLRSFKLHNPNVNFAILCDRENEYTKEFDRVVILKNPSFSYRDKFRLLTDCPYDENFYIESDCLVYKNLDYVWSYFENGCDFSTFGWNHGDNKIWFEDEDCIKGIENLFSNCKIPDIPIFNPGYLFIRNSEKTRKMFLDIEKIDDYLCECWIGCWNLFVGKNLRDDPLFCLAMAINEMYCPAKPEIGKCIFLPSGYSFQEIDILSGVLDVIDKKGQLYKNCPILHFSSRRAREEWLYPWQVHVLNTKIKGKPNFWVRFAESNFCALFFKAECFARKVFRKIKSIMK